MAELAMNEMTTYRWSFEEDVQQYRAAGLSAIGVWRQKLSDYGEQRGIELLASQQLQVSSLQWAGGFTGSDGHTHSESVEDAKDAIRLAAALRAGCLIVHSGARGVHTHNHARRLFRSALDRLLPFAESLDVNLAVEPMPRECGLDWTFLSSLDEALELTAAVKHDRLKIVLDTYHCGNDPTLPDRMAELAPRLGLVQLGDTRRPPCREHNRAPLGEGQVPLQQIIQSATAAGYRGFFEVELLGEEIESLDYRELLSKSQTAFAAWTSNGD